ncbi:MAG: orotidine-5'-phosphate decarboxylase, partial [Euryarchaeota archaeon]|nr:orotidine-5'-phosphate decarboxylase [Euryarchaeota archaeon]
MERKNGVILALDVEDRVRALEVAEAAAAHIDAVKVGYPLVLNTGLGIIEELKAHGMPVIADFKVADIPPVSSAICRTAVRRGADYVIVQGFLGEDVVEACAREARIFVVTEMSHPGATRFMAPAAEEVAAMAKRHAFGIVAPATRPERITALRRIVGEELTIISPGVAVQGGVPGDAIAAGADFEIVGRGIYAAEDPGKAARDMADRV